MILKSGSSLSVEYIRLFCDLLYLFVTFLCCLFSCWLISMATDRYKMIWLRANETCLTIRFTFFFLVFLWSATSAAILLRILRIFLHVFAPFVWSPTALTGSFVWPYSCFTKSSCLVAASFDLQMLSVLSRSNSCSLSSRSFVALSQILITILSLIKSVVGGRAKLARRSHISKSIREFVYFLFGTLRG